MTKSLWRRKRRRKNKEDGKKKLSDEQIKYNCDLAINDKKCKNNRLVLDSIWKKSGYDIAETRKLKQLILTDVNLGDDIKTMTMILDLICGKDLGVETKYPSIIENRERFLKNKLAFFHVKLDEKYYSHIIRMVSKLDRDYNKYYQDNAKKRNFPLSFDSKFLFGGYRNYTAWKYLNVAQLKVFLNHHRPLKEILYTICANQLTTELLIFSSIIFAYT
jgi:hypothetical protein